MKMINNNFLLSIIIPCYNEEDNILPLVTRLQKVIDIYNYEIIFVNDGSTDSTAQVIELMVLDNENIKYIHFSRNFGHQAAIKAGIDFSNGDCIITMDADLQHPPETIPKMIIQWQKGFEVVTATRNFNTKNTRFKRLSSKSYYWLLSKIADDKIIQNSADFRLFDKKIGDIIREMPEKNLYLRGLFSWMGFKQTTIYYNEEERAFGKTKYSAKKMLQLASNGITSSSVKPLRIALSIGVLFAFMSFGYGVYAIVSMWLGSTVSGWASIIATTVFLASIQLIILGVMGEYIGKLYIENKQRPTYLVTQTNIKETKVSVTTERRVAVS